MMMMMMIGMRFRTVFKPSRTNSNQSLPPPTLASKLMYAEVAKTNASAKAPSTHISSDACYAYLRTGNGFTSRKIDDSAVEFDYDIPLDELHKFDSACLATFVEAIKGLQFDKGDQILHDCRGNSSTPNLRWEIRFRCLQLFVVSLCWSQTFR
eukprot:m.98514 g.98514  ORF g.98514 m.98514 type:complete len:153 (+) comp9014_c7_seq3:1292-1750(+)